MIFNNVKENDPVIIRGGGPLGPGHYVRHVTKVTPAQFQIGNARYWRSNGDAVGGDNKAFKIDDPEANVKLKEDRRKREIYSLRNGDLFKGVPDDQCHLLYAICSDFIRSNKA